MHLRTHRLQDFDEMGVEGASPLAPGLALMQHAGKKPLHIWDDFAFMRLHVIDYLVGNSGISVKPANKVK